jgi:adenylate cyclase
MDRSAAKLAVLYADVCGSTALYEKFGDTIARADMAKSLEILADVATGLGGEAIKTIGDEIMCAFEDPVKAALAAGEMQAAMNKASEMQQFKMGTIQIKIGWHFGSVGWRDDDLIGEAPVAAQQVIGLANADEILTSKQSIDALPQAMFPQVHPIETIEAEAWDGQLEVYRFPWEQTGEETQFAPPSSEQLRAQTQTAEMILVHGAAQFRVGPAQIRCRIGRGEDTDLLVNGKLTSRQHVEIIYRNGRFSVRDESVNGTVIVRDNGEVKTLRREEGAISGSGRLGFGSSPDADPSCVVQFKCE